MSFRHPNSPMRVYVCIIELPYGDQALFMTRESYTEAGGIPDFKLMEDFILVGYSLKLL